MPFTPTERQRQAIEGRGSLLVSAAAGSGKTAVLVERILRRLTDERDPVDANRLLVVTFTKAAASEMRLRLNERMSREIAEHPGSVRLLRQQVLMQKACISTMDSFCYSLVREFPEQTGLSGDITLGTGGQLALIESAAMEQMLEEFYSREDGRFEQLVEVLGADRGDDSVVSAVRQIVNYVRSLPYPDAWMDSVLEEYRSFGSVSESETIRVLFEQAAHHVSDQIDRLRRAMKLAAQDPAMAKARGEALSSRKEWMEGLQRTLDGRDWDGVMSALLEYQPVKTPNLPRGYDDLARKEAVESARTGSDKAVAGLRKVFSISAQECVEQVRALTPSVELLLECVRRYLECLEERKREKHTMDFADVEYAALHLLVERSPDGSLHPTECARTIAARFDEVLVDEYQDINHLQNTIFEALSGQGERLFVVGDVKQSIYGFRQASPEIFLDRIRRYPAFDGQTSPSKIILDQNFRSREGVCEAVNFFFYLLMSYKAGGLRYDEEHALTPGAVYPAAEEAAASLLLLETAGGDESAEEIEVDRIARMIRDMMSRPCLTDPASQTLRPARYRDFTILLRAKSKMKVYAERLKQWGIPVWTDLQGDFLSSKEIAVMLSLLRVVDNPVNDVALLAAMLSPIFGFTADDAARLRADCRSGNLYAAVTKAAREGDPGCSRLLERLDEYRLWAAAMPCDRLIERLYDQTGYLSMVQAMENGPARRANLLLLLQYARDAQNSGIRELSGFLRFLNRLEQAGESMASAGTSNEADDVVRIMSIHRSKGLQFPVCILAGCSSPFNLSDSNAPIVLDREGGIGLMVTDDRARLRRTTVMREAIAAMTRQASLSEELRILYVAMTRAQEKLVMLVTCASASKTLRSVAEKLSSGYSGANDPFDAYHVLQGRSYADWLLACALVHPDGGVLRSMASGGMTAAFAKGRLDIAVEPYAAAQPAAENQDDECAPPLETLVDEIHDRLAFRYPYEALNGLAAKRSVSQLVKQQEGTEREYACLSRPAFLIEKGLSPAERGTALHEFMQYADYARAADDLEAEQKRLVREGFLTAEQVRGMDSNRLKAFFESPLYRRMSRSPHLQREVRFMVELPASELDPSLPEWGRNEMVMVQGIADCVFEEEGRMVIVDYKTDRVKSREPLVEHYAPQLALYARALDQTLPLPVGETLLYSFWLGESIPLS